MRLNVLTIARSPDNGSLRIATELVVARQTIGRIDE